MIKRLNLELGPTSYKALKQLQVSMDAVSEAETIRRALQTLRALMDEVEAGGRIVIERTNGEEAVFVLPGFLRRQT